MKIDDVSLTLFALDGFTPTVYAAHLGNPSGRSTLGLLTLRTDEGVEGHAFLGSPMRPATHDATALIEGLKPMLLGQDPLQRERLNRRMHDWSRTYTRRPMGAVDVALWDIAGKCAGMPIHRLLGSYRDSIPAYASSQKLASPQAYVEQALDFKSRGWQAYKIHPIGDPDRDLAICEAVRAAVGDAYPLMLDAAFAYRFDDAVRIGQAIQSLGFRWYEDPLDEHDLYHYKQLRQRLSIPVMATELPAMSLEAYGIWITERATDMLRGDVPFKGGITTMLKTAHLAEAFSMTYEIHHGGNSINNLAGLHVAMAIRNCDWFEVLLPAQTHRYGLVEDIDVDAQGVFHAPQGPGLGARIDFELIERKKVALLR